ncbi:MAG: S8 family serine peptidase, partial [Rhodothermales bacterium]
PSPDPAEVIVDNVFYFTEPFYQDGFIAREVDRVVAAGHAYFTAAGNNARQAYENSYRWAGTQIMPGVNPTSPPHDFDPGTGMDVFQKIRLASGTTTFSFQWSQPYISAAAGSGGALSDMDIYLYTEPPGAAPIASGIDLNIGGDPIEVFSYTNPGPPTLFNLAITKFSGPDPWLMKYLFFNSGSEILEYPTHSSTVVGHSSAAGAATVGAAFYFETPPFGTAPPVIEGFSSAGPQTILFDTAGNPLAQPQTRYKPIFTAPDGGNTTFFGSDIPDPGDGSDLDAFPNFFGTSAAAAHAAGAAALMLESLGGPGSLTPAAIHDTLGDTAIDMAPSGFDFESGYGLIDVDAAVTAALPVELVSFTAVADGNAAILQWETASETNNAGFDIQHRYFDGDFESVDFVEGYGTTLEAQRYTYRLENLDPGPHTFRLKQIDFDGTFEHHGEVEVFVELPGRYALSEAYPNPFNPETQFTLVLARAQQVRVEAYDVIGRRVALLHDGLFEADELHRLTFAASHLPSGLYVVRVVGETFTASTSALLVK